MSTPLLPEVVPEIDANPVSVYAGGEGSGVGHGLELDSPFASLKVTILEFAYKSERQFKKKIFDTIASGIAYTLQRYQRVSV